MKNDDFSFLIFEVRNVLLKRMLDFRNQKSAIIILYSDF
jgi:hypothetical protein